MNNDELAYIVVDIEADGPTPGLHSMLSLAAVATTASGEKGSFYKKVLPVTGASADPDTAAWWETQPDALREVQTNQETAQEVMEAFVSWLAEMSSEPIFASSPTALDYTFVSWYLHNIAGCNPFIGAKNYFRVLDIRSLIAGKFNLSFPESSRSLFPEALTAGMPEHTHKAIDDARGYAILLRTLLNWGDKPNPYRN